MTDEGQIALGWVRRRAYAGATADPAKVTADGVRELARRAALEICPEPVAVFISQSSLALPRDPYGDIDVVVVAPEADYYARHCKVRYGVPVELQLVGADFIPHVITWMRRTGYPLFLDIVDAGEAVIGGETAEAIRARLSAVYKEGPSPPTTSQLGLLREQVTNLVLDLGRAEPCEEAMATGLSLYAPLLKMAFLQRRVWVDRGKYARRSLGELDPEFAEKLDEAFRDLVAGEPSLLIELAAETLAACGGPAWAGIKSRNKLGTPGDSSEPR
jgi:hypothetical protein